MMSHLPLLLVVSAAIFFIVDAILIVLCLVWWYRKWRDGNVAESEEQPLINIPTEPEYQTKEIRLPTSEPFNIPSLKRENTKKELSKIGSIDKSIYRKKEKIPALCFELFYDLRKSEVHVTLEEGKHLPEYINEQIIVSVLMSHCFTVYQTVRVDGPNPTFNEIFRFPLDSMQISSDPPITLKFNVWTISDQFNKNPFGFTEVNIEDIFNEAGLTPIKGCGTIWRDVEKSERLTGETPYGEVLVTLSYLRGAQRIALTTCKARNLKIQPTDKYLQAKIALLYQDKEIKVYYTNNVATTTKPEFNEEFIFNLEEVQGASLQNIAISIEIQGRQNNVFLKPRVIGTVALGNSTQVGRFGKEHWDLMAHGKSSIQKWYPVLFDS
ncbi:synaptotagmin-10-like [Hydractinia symbiolongicarpus]|uniref:synaptotagmin-10-like n=1 Tax=Hydractinia symbiolongicarpus TaxID=13093 RepID=UPI0025506A37|nr:synaptotagmin-10-like [Hydractinia symbiolongicarpus]XP_057292114.1 synaptotagmin-10-like [Hydractinia symbiolongicarpus]XP_057292115.1 synaptotagmin-10-like [Hydractinia symbiolongicarpus]